MNTCSFRSERSLAVQSVASVADLELSRSPHCADLAAHVLVIATARLASGISHYIDVRRVLESLCHSDQGRLELPIRPVREQHSDPMDADSAQAGHVDHEMLRERRRFESVASRVSAGRDQREQREVWVGVFGLEPLPSDHALDRRQTNGAGILGDDSPTCGLQGERVGGIRRHLASADGRQDSILRDVSHRSMRSEGNDRRERQRLPSIRERREEAVFDRSHRWEDRRRSGESSLPIPAKHVGRIDRGRSRAHDGEQQRREVRPRKRRKSIHEIGVTE